MKIVVVIVATGAEETRVAFHDNQRALNDWFDRYAILNGGRIPSRLMESALAELQRDGGRFLSLSQSPEAVAFVGRRCFVDVEAAMDNPLRDGTRIRRLIA